MGSFSHLNLFNYANILSWYTDVKHFPDNSKLITNQKNGFPVIKGKASGIYIFVDALCYGILFTVLSIMIIASVINYEVMFRPKVRYATKDGGGDVDYYDEYYSKPENAIGRYFYAPLLSIVVLILFCGLVHYKD